MAVPWSAEGYLISGADGKTPTKERGGEPRKVLPVLSIPPTNPARARFSMSQGPLVLRCGLFGLLFSSVLPNRLPDVLRQKSALTRRALPAKLPGESSPARSRNGGTMRSAALLCLVFFSGLGLGFIVASWRPSHAPAAPKRSISAGVDARAADRKSTRLNSSHSQISYAVF